MLGPSATDNEDTVGVSPVKSVSKPPDQSSNGEFTEVKYLFHILPDLKAAVASVGALPPSHQASVLSPVRVAVSSPPFS